jgi:hypothetical protein
MTDGAGSIGRQIGFDIDRHFGWSKSTAFQVRINGTKVSREGHIGHMNLMSLKGVLCLGPACDRQTIVRRQFTHLRTSINGQDQIP